MVDTQIRRRRFLAASLLFSTAAVSGGAWLRAASAWAGSTDGETLARFGRLLFPHDALPDTTYARVMDDVLTRLASNPATRDALTLAEQALDARQPGRWFDQDEAAQIAAIEAIDAEAWFADVLGTVRSTFYYDAEVWSHLGYPGSSKEHGGYKFRGFDDIDWLPEQG